MVFCGGPSLAERILAFGIRWLILALSVATAAWLVDGIWLDGWESTLLVALILGLLNAYLKPLLFWFSLPLTIVTLGAFLVIINIGLLALTAWIAGKFDDIHFAIDGFWDAFFGAIIISVVSFLVSRVIDPKVVARNLSR